MFAIDIYEPFVLCPNCLIARNCQTYQVIQGKMKIKESYISSPGIYSTLPEATAAGPTLGQF